MVSITFNGLISDEKSILTILLLNNGCLYQEPVLFVIWRYSSLFSIKLFTHFALKKDFLLDSQAFRLKIGSFSKVTGRISASRTAHEWKFFFDIFCLKKLINSILSQSWLKMSIRSAMKKIYAKYSSGGTTLCWRRWNELRNRRNKQRKHERVLNFYCWPKIRKIHNIQQNTTSKPSASFGRKKNE